MDISTTLWLSELEMDDPLIVSHQSQMSSLEESRYSANPISLSPQESTPPPVDSSRSFFRSENNSKGTTPPAKLLKTTSKMIPKPSSSTIISFHSAISETAQYNGDNVNDNIGSFLGISEGNRKASTTTRNPLQAQDHVIAERQRRERLSQMFIQLSSLVPGIKKIDKASVLGEAANYIKQLQGRVKTLEKKVIEKDGEAIVSVDRSRPHFGEESSSSGDDNFANYNESIPEIEVRISETDVFLRIQSKKIPGIAVKMLSNIEKLHMTIISSSVMPFANNSLLITVIAQMNVEFCMTANDLMKRLNLQL